MNEKTKHDKAKSLVSFEVGGRIAKLAIQFIAKVAFVSASIWRDQYLQFVHFLTN